MKWVPWSEFDRLTAEHGADHRVRRLPTKSQFIALLYGPFSGAASLREIIGGLESHAARLYHVGGHAVTRSTLADANAVRPSAVFSELFAHMVARAQRGLRLSGGRAEWAWFSAGVCGAKVHVAVALIAFLLLRLAQAAQKAVESPLAFARLVRANLMHRKRIDRMIGAGPRPRTDPNQMVLQWA